MLDGHAMCISDAAPGAVFMACRMGLFRSDDGAKSWNDIEVGRFSPLTYARDIRPAPQDPTHLYACLSVHATGNTGSLAKSDDLGTSWRRIDHGVPIHATFMQLALHAGDAESSLWRGAQRPDRRHAGWRQELARISSAPRLRGCLRHRLRLRRLEPR